MQPALARGGVIVSQGGVRVCTGKSCRKAGSPKLLQALLNKGVKDVNECGCRDRCKAAPVVVIDKKVHTHATLNKLLRLLEGHLRDVADEAPPLEDQAQEIDLAIASGGSDDELWRRAFAPPR